MRRGRRTPLSVHFRDRVRHAFGRLQAVLGDVGRAKRLDEESVSKAMREIRLALLEADVNFEVVKRFVEGVRERALGHDVLSGARRGTAGRQDRLRGAHGAHGRGRRATSCSAGRRPVSSLGLQGSGKTTTGEARAAPRTRGQDARSCFRRPVSSGCETNWRSSVVDRQVPVFEGGGDPSRFARPASRGLRAGVRHGDHRHGGSAPRRRRTNGGAGADPRSGAAARGALRADAMTGQEAVTRRRRSRAGSGLPASF